LSLPEFFVQTKRPKSLRLRYFDLFGEMHEEDFSGFWARAVCHEMDHLNGILISKHLETEVSKQIMKNTFGMKLTPQKQNQLKRRRTKAKNARKSRRINRA